MRGGRKDAAAIALGVAGGTLLAFWWKGRSSTAAPSVLDLPPTPVERAPEHERVHAISGRGYYR